MSEILAGRHALVTGGGTGIGLAIARSLAGAGAEVTITGRRLNVLQTVAGDGLFPVEMDVTQEESVVSGFATAEAARGPVSICVANAGIAEGASVAKTEMDLWRRIMATNLDGAFLTLRAALPGMREAGWGRGIVVSSIAGLRGLKGAAAYAASKHGVLGLVRTMALDFATAPMTFNALCPGYVATDIIGQNIERIMDRTGMSADEAEKVMVSANPHGQLITPSEVAAAALWLCSPGSESVNGAAIEIAGA